MERIDDLQLKGLRIIQDTDLFCFGMDAVLLSTYAQVKPGEKVLDLCCGNGAVALLLAGKTQAEQITGIELQPKVATLAGRSVELNGLSDRVRIVEGDLRELTEKSAYDVVTCNPPYMVSGSALANPEDAKAVARHELCCTFSDVAKAAKQALVPGGRFYLVHRPFRLVDILCTLRENQLEPKRMKFVHSYVGKEPSLVLIESIRGGRAQLNVESPLIVYEKPDVYTEELKQWYYGE